MHRTSKRRPSLTSIAAGIVLVSMAGSAGGADTNYTTGKQHWLAAAYPLAYPPLYSYRGGPYGRTAEVDYMLGTSACRMDGRQSWGARVLNYILYSYALTEKSRQQVLVERDLCRSGGALAALTPESRNGLDDLIGTSATATARGKMFYFAEDESIAAYPAKRKREMTRAELEARLVPVGEAERIAAVLRPLAPKGARVRTVGRFAFVTGAGQTDAELNEIAAQLERYVTFLTAEYELAVPADYLTIYLAPSIDAVREIAERVHGLDVSPSTLGYTFQDDFSAAVFTVGPQTGTLRHELFHLLVRSSFGDIPQWLDEGIAGLYEVSKADADRFVGLPNWRGRVLRELWGQRPKLNEVITSPWFGFDSTDGRSGLEGDTARIALNLATARYFALFLQERKKLRPLYQAFKSRDPGAADDPASAAVALVESQLGPLDDLDRDFSAWFQKLEDAL